MLWVGQFGIIAGEARENSPWVGIHPPSGHTGPKEATDLFLVVEPALPGSEDYCGELSQIMSDKFHEKTLSLTGGILRSLKAAHEHLRDWNRRSLKEHQIGAGVSCLAVRGTEAYLGQVGPTAALTLRDGSLTRLAPTLPDATEALGINEESRPDLSRHELNQGDRLLLLSSELASALSDDDLLEALQRPADETLPKLYRLGKEIPDCGALLIAVLPEAAS